MKIVIWVLTVVVAIFSALMVAVMAFAVDWLSANMVGGSDLVKQLAQMPVPAWLSVFLDPAMLEWVRTASAGLLTTVATGLPWLAPVIGWLGPILWVIWFIFLLCLLGLAAVLHYLVGRRQRSA